MGRFWRRRTNGREWVSRLPSHFTMADLASAVRREHLREALAWLYDAIERGRIEPRRGPGGMHYEFTGRRRGDDRYSRAPREGSQPVSSRRSSTR